MYPYTIYCTEEQTKRAYKLCAPILRYKSIFISESAPYYEEYLYGDRYIFVIPTAEQMCGWLEEQGVYLEQRHTDEKKFHIWVGSFIPHPDGDWTDSYSSRKEATLAAIDVSLDYLKKRKEANNESKTCN